MRLELIDFFLARGERDRALSELLVMNVNLPADTVIQVQVGKLFLSAGDPRQALDRFVGALGEDPEHGPALAGAGESAFELGDYVGARRYLNAAPRDDERVAELREVAELVLVSDPLEPRLAASERRRRLLVALKEATRSLEVCLVGSLVAARTGLESIRTEALDFEAAVAAQPRGDVRDLVDDGVDLIYRIERSIEPSCRSLTTPLDRALLLIGRRRGFEQP